MTPEIEEIYSQVGLYITQSIAERWEEAWISVEFAPGVISSQGCYRKSKNSDLCYFPVTGDINRLFMKLRQLVRKNETQMWAKSRYTLQANGPFKIEFEY